MSALCTHWDTMEIICSTRVELHFRKWPYAADGWEWYWCYKTPPYSPKISLCSAALWYPGICQRPRTWKGSPVWAFVEKSSARCHMKGKKGTWWEMWKCPRRRSVFLADRSFFWSPLDSCCTFSDTFWMAFYSCRCLGLITAWYQLTVQLFSVLSGPNAW